MKVNLTKSQIRWLHFTLDQMVANGFWEKNRPELDKVKRIIKRFGKVIKNEL